MLEWIVSSSLLIAVVMAIRYICLGRISPAMQYALWGLVLIRLLLPFTVGESAISIENALRTGGGYAVSERAAPTGFASDAQPSEELPPTGGTAVAEDITPLLPYLWLTGTTALTLWFAAVNFSVRYFTNSAFKMLKNSVFIGSSFLECSEMSGRSWALLENS